MFGTNISDRPPITQWSDWFALRVKPKHEKQVAGVVTLLGFEHLLPLYSSRRQWNKRSALVELPLFPGYVFCQFDRGSWVRIINLPGVLDVVRSGKTPAVLSHNEIRSLRFLQRTTAGREPWPHVPPGEQIRITAGPLAGVVGKLMEVRGRRRLILSVNLLQRSVLVDLDAGQADSTVAWAAYAQSFCKPVGGTCSRKQ